jgi:uncharacterized membrane-anchored protein YitT (DUF2179 family)
MSLKLRDYLLMALGALAIALGLNLFLVPNSIAAGGASGLSTVLYKSLGFPVSLSVLFINLFLFILGGKFLSRDNFFKTVAATLFLSALIEVMSGIRPVTDNRLLASVYGGVLFGIGTGLTVSNGGSTGGTDLAAVIIHKWVNTFSVARIILIIDFFVIILSGIVFKDYEIMLYAAIALYIASRIADDIIEGVNFTKLVYVISDNSELIADGIMETLGRGVTALDGTGMYKKKDVSVLMCAIRKNEFVKFKNIVNSIDKNAFIILTDAREVLGKGFKTNK